MYAGSRFAVGCHPDEFMQPNGYTTSSHVVNSIIKTEGINSFEILRIDYNCDGIHPYQYETAFLQCLDCANSPDWFNGHNNDNILALGTERFANMLFLKYGVYRTAHIPGIQNKIKQTKKLIYGDENYNNREKALATWITLYGGYPLQCDKIKQKSKQTRLERYGDENYNNSNKNKQTKLERYGDENYNNRELVKETCLTNWGYISSNKSPIVKETQKHSLLNKYGVDHNSKIPEVKENKRNHFLKTYGVDNQGKIPFLSIIETKKTYSKAHISRHFKQFKPFY